jgi:hypothetical protein
MSTVAQEQEADFAHIDEVDRIELHVAERQVECTVFDDARRLRKYSCIKPVGAQMGPREAGFFEIFLDFLVHTTKKEGGTCPDQSLP